MPSKTITVTNGDGSTKTITIPDRSRFAGKRTMSRVTGGVSDDITVDRTAQVVTSDRKGESRPLLTKVVGGATAAYSLRDLNDKAGNNKVVRVRRDSDNNEKDFTAKELSNGTLTAWVGAGNDGFVETWYDQSGNGNDATQLTASSQPKIVDAGALVAGGIDFSPRQSFEVNISVTRPNLFAVFRSPNVVTSSSVVHLMDNQQTFESIHFRLETPSQYTRYIHGLGYTQDVVSMNTDGTDNLVSALNQTAVQGGSSLHINGSPMTVALTGSDNSMVIDRIGKSLWGNSINQVMDEWIIYDSDQSANRAAIEANINNQYDIY